MLSGRHRRAPRGGTALRVLLAAAFAALAWLLLGVAFGTTSAHAAESTDTAETSTADDGTAATGGGAAAETPAEASPDSSTTDASAGSAAGSGTSSAPSGEDSATPADDASADTGTAGTAQTGMDDSAEPPTGNDDQTPADTADPSTESDEPADATSTDPESGNAENGGNGRTADDTSGTGAGSTASGSTAGSDTLGSAGHWATSASTDTTSSAATWVAEQVIRRSERDMTWMRSDPYALSWFSRHGPAGNSLGSTDSVPPRSDAKIAAPWAAHSGASGGTGSGRRPSTADVDPGSAETSTETTTETTTADDASSAPAATPVTGTSSGTNSDRLPWPMFPSENGGTASLGACSPGAGAEATGGANCGITLGLWIGGHGHLGMVVPLSHVPTVRDPSRIGDPRGPPAWWPRHCSPTLRSGAPGTTVRWPVHWADGWPTDRRSGWFLIRIRCAAPVDAPTGPGDVAAPPVGTSEPGTAATSTDEASRSTAVPSDTGPETGPVFPQPARLDLASTVVADAENVAPLLPATTGTIADSVVTSPPAATERRSQPDGATFWLPLPLPLPLPEPLPVPEPFAATPAPPADLDPQPSAPVPSDAPSPGTASIGPGNGTGADNTQVPMALSSAPTASLGLYLIGIGLGVAALVVLAQLPWRRRRRSWRLS